MSDYVYKHAGKRLLASVFDAVGGFFFFFIRRSFPISKDRVKRILLIRLDHIGDVLLTRPSMNALHDAFPSAQIDLLVSADLVPIFEDAREIREIISMRHHWFSRSADKKQTLPEFFQVLKRVRANRYDLAIDFRGDLRHILLMALAGIPVRAGYNLTGGGFLLTHTAPYSKEIHQVHAQFNLLNSLGLKTGEPRNFPISYSGSRKWKFWNATGRLLPADTRRIVIHPGAGDAAKQWPAANFEKLIQTILNEKLGQVILVGTEAEKKSLRLEGPDILDLRGKTGLEELPILLDCCDLFIGNDSGPAHIAAAQGSPMIVLFNTLHDPNVWKPLSNKLELLPFSNNENMPPVAPETVMQRVRSVLTQTTAAKP